MAFYGNIIEYLKNHWTKYRLVCTHFDAFHMLSPNMDIIFNNFEIFDNFLQKIDMSSACDVAMESVNAFNSYYYLCTKQQQSGLIKAVPFNKHTCAVEDYGQVFTWLG